MARKKGAAGPSILRSSVKRMAVPASAASGHTSAANNVRPASAANNVRRESATDAARAADRVSRVRSTMAMPGFLLGFVSSLGAPVPPPRPDKEHAAAKRKQKLPG